MCAPEIFKKADEELCATFRGEELQYGPNQFHYWSSSFSL